MCLCFCLCFTYWIGYFDHELASRLTRVGDSYKIDFICRVSLSLFLTSSFKMFYIELVKLLFFQQLACFHTERRIRYLLFCVDYTTNTREFWIVSCPYIYTGILFWEKVQTLYLTSWFERCEIKTNYGIWKLWGEICCSKLGRNNNITFWTRQCNSVFFTGLQIGKLVASNKTVRRVIENWIIAIICKWYKK